MIFSSVLYFRRLSLLPAAFLCFALALAFAPAQAQDAEFSQFYAAPSYTNPAMIGFTTDPRLSLNYRHQYASFGNAYMTLAAAYDQHFSDYNSSIGVSVLADRTGEGGIYNTYSFGVQYAYQLQLTRNMRFKAGAQVAYLNKSLAWDKVVLGDMIDPRTGQPVLPSLDGMPENTSLHRFDLSLGGVAYSETFYIGAAFKHITRPSITFTNSADVDNNLSMRSLVHIGKVFYLGQIKTHKPRLYVSPNLLFVNQGNFNQISAGAYIGKGMLMGGLWFRHALRNSDSVIGLIGFKKDIFRIGYSFDIGVSGIGTSAGAHELSLLLDFGDNPYTKAAERQRQKRECPEMW